MSKCEIIGKDCPKCGESKYNIRAYDFSQYGILTIRFKCPKCGKSWIESCHCDECNQGRKRAQQRFDELEQYAMPQLDIKC